MAIPFTQFLMPHGKQVPITIDRPAPIELLAQSLIERGCLFEIEMLSTGEISMEVVGKAERVIAAEICENGPAVPIAVDNMIRNATKRLCESALKT